MFENAALDEDVWAVYLQRVSNIKARKKEPED